MKKSPVSADVAFQQRFVAKARRELGLTRASYQPGYLRDYDRAGGRFTPQSITEPALAAALAPADLLLAGDFHTLAATQTEAIRLLAFWRRLEPGRPHALALECFTARDQEALDAFQTGELDEMEFLRRTRWNREWGFSFAHYRPLLTAAASAEIQVLALDAFPRGDFREVRARDRFMARRLAELHVQEPALRTFVLVGETHLAPGHLPRALAREAGLRGVSVAAVLQNVDQVYWNLSPAQRESGSGYFSLAAEDSFALGSPPYFMALSASPVQKYESWRAYMAGLTGESGRLSTEAKSFYDLIESLLGVLRIPKTRCLTRSRAGVKFLSDYYPEVLGPAHFGEFGDRVQGSAMPETRKRTTLSRAPEIGRFYCAPLNLMWIGDAPLRDLAESAGYFINLALKGRVGMVRPLDLPFTDRLSERIIEEALSYTGSKFVGPERRFHALEVLGDTLAWLEATGVKGEDSLEWRAEVRRYHQAETRLDSLRAAESLLHEALAARGKARAERSLEAALSDPQLFVLAVHEWGYLLGERLFDQVQARKLGPPALRAAFTRRFTQPGDARRELRRLWRVAGAEPSAG